MVQNAVVVERRIPITAAETVHMGHCGVRSVWWTGTLIIHFMSSK